MHLASRVTNARSNARRVHSVRTVCKSVDAKMTRRAIQKLDNVSVPLDGKGIDVIGRAMPAPGEKIVRSVAIVSMTVRAIRKPGNALAVRDGLAMPAKPNVASDDSDIIVHSNAIAISTIRSLAMLLMAAANANHRGPVS